MLAVFGDARSSANRTIKAIKLLIANKQALDPEAVEDLQDDLVVALQKLSAAFKLDQGIPELQRPLHELGGAHRAHGEGEPGLGCRASPPSAQAP